MRKAARSAFPPKEMTIVDPPKSKGKKSAEEKKAVLKDFLTQLSQHQFVLAPHGHGVDTHRLWESMYMGCIPVTTASAMDSSLLKHAEYELPVVVLEKAEDLTAEIVKTSIDDPESGPAKLIKLQSGGGSSLSIPARTMAFWRGKIHSHRDFG